MNTERDKVLTEAMGECWHEYGTNPDWLCVKCGYGYRRDDSTSFFSTWNGFGLLWEYSQKQEWFDDLPYTWRTKGGITAIDLSFINPDHFADAVYNFLKERNK